MTSNEIRQSFLDFFVSKGHRIIPSSPVVPHGDPTLLFTNAGMNQFKDVFLGEGKRDYTRAADTQKCIRVSGKHNDLEEVGVDTYHHTFFEMLGNWSFGDYYKAEAIEWAWELLTKIWRLEPERLYATVYRTDDESYNLWKRFLPESRIQRFDEKDNFWEMGETGPCGPCSEVHYDRTPDLSGAKFVNSGLPEVIEIWNLVFIQFNRRSDGSLEELPNKYVDTGMGFERICSVIQGKSSNYDTDIFVPLINKIAELSGKNYLIDLNNQDGIAMRVIADHIRTLSFAIADGAMPGNEGRGFVLRRILRRGMRFVRNLGIKEPFIYKLLPILVETMSITFPEIKSQQNFIERIIKGEEESFLQTLERGLEKFEEIKHKMAKSEFQDAIIIITGDDAFLLSDTFGFPLDLTQQLARENNLTVDDVGFDLRMQEQRERSRKAQKKFIQEAANISTDAISKFTGYNELATEATVLLVEKNLIVLDKTPFYVESGGQVSDTGWITLAGERYEVLDVYKSGNAIFHVCDRTVEPLTGSIALANVNIRRRHAIMRNHSATHLLQEALIQVLGNHIKQSGSLVSPDYLRFDFNNFEKLSDKEILAIEHIVNEKIFDNIPVQTQILSLEDAQKNSHIKMFFGDKYGDVVRVITMDEKFSQELCGGTHVRSTAEIGIFKIISESSIAAGVRRIEAVTGKGVEKYIKELNTKLSEKESQYEALTEQLHKLDKELKTIGLEKVKNSSEDWIKNASNINGISLVAVEIKAENIEQMRQIAENLRNRLRKMGIGLIVSVIDEKAQLVCVSTDDILNKFPAGKLAAAAAERLGGKGGGKPHLASAGGKDIANIPQLLKEFPEIVRSFF
jgi:alanyl-tRNA synthetase